MRLTAYLLSLSLIFQACSQQEQNPKTAPIAKELPTIYTLIFFDKTVSVSPKDTFTRNTYEAALATITQENIRQKGDKIEVYFIHENTSQARVFSQQCKATLKDTLNLSPTDVRAIKNNYQITLKKERKKIFTRCQEAFLDENPSDTKKYTDIWGALEVIDKKNAKKKEGTLLKVYFFSDMVESMPGADRRDFHKRPPFSNQEAQEWAKSDAKSFQDMDLEGVELFYLLPFSPLSNTNENNPKVLLYWNSLLGKLGVEELKEFGSDE
ncbi:MAG: hypothetical protein SFU27_03145 [Thermonemataceae bacterium]|nr:hypothetical protein [Thermonemataceae bacterium]